jgi:drug/metabolite transporter (DMT)-like permease
MQLKAPQNNQLKGWILGVLGILTLSPDTLIIRLVDSDPWTFIAWRGAFMAIGILFILSFSYRLQVFSKFFAVGWLGCLIAVIFSINNVFFQLSVQTTAVANTLVIVATSPLFAAVMSVLFLKERIKNTTWGVILISVIGVSIVFIGKLESGDLFGNFAALLVAVGMGAHFVLVRLARPTDMAPAVAIASVLTCLVGLVMAPDLYLSPHQFGYLAALGLILLPVSFIFLTRAPIYITAPEVSLILLLETILGPLWVWMVIQEEPPLATLIGGALIMLTLVFHAGASIRDNHNKPNQ